MIWFTGDQHWGHANIIGYTNRPFDDIKEMNRVLVENWNMCIQPGDTVYHLGDFCFPRDINIEILLASLKGNIILIKGNHDKQKTTKYFKNVYQNLEMQIGPYKCILNHRPVYPKGTPDPYNDHAKDIDPDNYDFILSGHIHERRLFTGKSLNVGVDVHNFEPITIDEVIGLLDARKKELDEENIKK